LISLCRDLNNFVIKKAGIVAPGRSRVLLHTAQRKKEGKLQTGIPERTAVRLV
jgi:hypothetical protein